MADNRSSGIVDEWPCVRCRGKGEVRRGGAGEVKRVGDANGGEMKDGASETALDDACEIGTCGSSNWILSQILCSIIFTDEVSSSILFTSAVTSSLTDGSKKKTRVITK